MAHQPISEDIKACIQKGILPSIYLRMTEHPPQEPLNAYFLYAVECAQVYVVEYLLKRGADVYTKNNISLRNCIFLNTSKPSGAFAFLHPQNFILTGS